MRTGAKRGDPDEPARPGGGTGTAADRATTALVRTAVPARLDRLPWSGWHWRIVIGLGTVWILDGLEVTLVGNMAARLAEPGSGLDITASQVSGLGAALYVTGACTGALFFGWLTDRFGRKKLFLITLAVYLAATGLTALAWTPGFFYAMRFCTGLGIGGEYAAVNSAIDELIPSAYRGRIDIVINGSFWIGAFAGSLLSMVFLRTAFFPVGVGWRLAFGLGVILGFVILLVRRHVPESPRWLFIHGRAEEAESVAGQAEEAARHATGRELPPPAGEITIRQRHTIGFVTIARTVFTRYPRRTALGLSLFIGQAFLYNAVTFGYATILVTFYDVPDDSTGYYYAVIAFGNFLGPLLLSRLFDTVGRKPMISGTYILSGLLLFVTAFLFDREALSAVTLTACWTVALFFASAGASSAYLTVSEIFPMETRAMAIAFFYAVGTAAGGISGPLVFASLTESGVPRDTALAFGLGATLMVAAGVVELFLGVKAERRGLESIATPLSAEPDEPPGQPPR
ncbi:MFS transporter [Streptomyces specialis]|uniref:MFS transporter n=1 Tax=Streptomyces specialis TaxID=498367 RepID=UPI00073EC986|nr:MFS transporter [Streptomyces specialis]